MKGTVRSSPEPSDRLRKSLCGKTFARLITTDAMTPSDRSSDVLEQFPQALKLCEVTGSLNPW